MILYVTKNKEFFGSSVYTIITVEKSLAILEKWNMFQFDTETTGLDCHLDTLLLAQFGNKAAGIQIVVDCTTIDLRLYKDYIESHYMIGQNLKFDIKFLFNYDIHPTNVYDTMVVEQLLYLGYPAGIIRFGLAAIADRRLGIDIDKTIRSQINTRGIDAAVIKYAADDVKYLEDIMTLQLADCRSNNILKGAKLECDFVPVIAYLEWCGIKLSIPKWKEKMRIDQSNLSKTREELNKYVINKYSDLYPEFFLPDFFEGMIMAISWSSSDQVIPFVQKLGFSTKVEDKKKGGFKDSVQEKNLKGQIGIDDQFLKLYFKFKEYDKVCSTYGQNYINAINPRTKRIHTEFRQLGTTSGRMACGSGKVNVSLAKLKKLPQVKQKDNTKQCGYPQLQNLPANEETRSSFVADTGNFMLSCDYSALESRLGADIYQEQSMIEEYKNGSGDIHSLAAKACFSEELEGIEVKDIKRLRPDLRKKAKAPEFAIQFGGGSFAVAAGLGITIEKAQDIVDKFKAAFPGMTSFGEKGHKKVIALGYVMMNEITGHKMIWWDWEKWKKRQETFTYEFWDEYRKLKESMPIKEFKKTPMAKKVSNHFKASSKWGRMALNAPTQGSGIIILKDAMIDFYRWILANNLFKVVRICNLVHDEAVVEYPKQLNGKVDLKLQECMEKSADKYCKSLPIPAEGEVGEYWIH